MSADNHKHRYTFLWHQNVNFAISRHYIGYDVLEEAEANKATGKDELSFSTVRAKIMGKVDWSMNMFLDCERHDFVLQAYHRELLEHMPPPPPPRVIIRRPPSLPQGTTFVKTRIRKKISQKPGRGDKKRHRKVAGGSRDSKTF
ncbi:hypothetical protein D8674_005351 [Pyrus ussuriensis x Pyrus communis]|uniref:TOD1/MUCI70 glycosyltransferase-like domain-containing protein n=1 Tax=Pyrus ussuriensis x Pyrus communis TaxID=2448454 RepID=A0A5N5G4Y8_9ROSA|nr:hypothetical protein D8674_005351 [Pyrus ussuriensis x Pyrus communis]